jgi:hypothetical protein
MKQSETIEWIRRGIKPSLEVADPLKHKVLSSLLACTCAKLPALAFGLCHIFSVLVFRNSPTIGHACTALCAASCLPPEAHACAHQCRSGSAPRQFQ